MTPTRRIVALGLATLAGCRAVDAPILRPPLPAALLSDRPPAVADPVAPAAPTTPAALPTGPEQPIDLAAALAAAGADNPTIAIAAEATRLAEANRLAADALLLPTLRAGASANWHNGPLLATSGVLRVVDRESAYAGAGAFTVGGGTVAVPGVRVIGHIADAVYEPQVARARLAVAVGDATAVSNAVLLDAANRYFDLLAAAAQRAALEQSLAELTDIAEMTANFAGAGQGRQADADRAACELNLLRTQVAVADERLAVAAAELARLLHRDPTVNLRATDPLTPLRLVPADCPLDALLAQAAAGRPELAARAAGVAAAERRVRQECVRPFVPLISAGYSAGGFGGGSNLAPVPFTSLSGRGDFDALALWSLDGLGFGNLALQRQRRAELAQARADQVATLDRVRREVAEAYANAQARSLEVDVVRRALRSAEDGYRLDAKRGRNLQGLPIELLNSATRLATARADVIQAITAANVAQMQLLVALGRRPE